MTPVLALHLLSQASLAMDCGQTLQIKRHPDKHETNPLLGAHPSDARVLAYFAVTMTANELAHRTLPPWAQVAVSIGVLAIEVPVTTRNFALGYKLGW